MSFRPRGAFAPIARRPSIKDSLEDDKERKKKRSSRKTHSRSQSKDISISKGKTQRTFICIIFISIYAQCYLNYTIIHVCVIMLYLRCIYILYQHVIFTLYLQREWHGNNEQRAQALVNHKDIYSRAHHSVHDGLRYMLDNSSTPKMVMTQ